MALGSSSLVEYFKDKVLGSIRCKKRGGPKTSSKRITNAGGKPAAWVDANRPAPLAYGRAKGVGKALEMRGLWENPTVRPMVQASRDG